MPLRPVQHILHCVLLLHCFYTASTLLLHCCVYTARECHPVLLVRGCVRGYTRETTQGRCNTKDQRCPPTWKSFARAGGEALQTPCSLCSRSSTNRYPIAIERRNPVVSAVNHQAKAHNHVNGRRTVQEQGTVLYVHNLMRTLRCFAWVWVRCCGTA